MPFHVGFKSQKLLFSQTLRTFVIGVLFQPSTLTSRRL